MVLSVVAPIAILSATFFIFEATALNFPDARMRAYQYCFASFCIIALCIETRVRMGYRLPRGPLFWVHLPCAVVFFVFLGALAFIQLPRIVGFFELGLFLIVLGTGAVLFYRGLNATLSSRKTLRKVL
jgi:hypothetical protein